MGYPHWTFRYWGWLPLYPHWTLQLLPDNRVQTTIVTKVLGLRSEAWKLTRTGLAAQLSREAICITVEPTRAVIDLKIILLKHLQPPGELTFWFK